MACRIWMASMGGRHIGLVVRYTGSTLYFSLHLLIHVFPNCQKVDSIKLYLSLLVCIYSDRQWLYLFFCYVLYSYIHIPAWGEFVFTIIVLSLVLTTGIF